MDRYRNRTFFIFSLSFFAFTASFGIYLYYKVQSQQSFSVDSYIETVNYSASLDNVKKIVSSDFNTNQIHRSREFFSKFSKVEKSVKSINSALDIESENLDKAFKGIKKNFNSLVSKPLFNDLLTVFKRRTQSFLAFARENKWPTLTRISKRIIARFDSLMVKNKERFQAQSSAQTVKLIRDDINQLDKITKNSRLTNENKEMVIKRLGPIKEELNNISLTLSAFKVFENNLFAYKNQVKKWIHEVAPLIEEKKMAFSQGAKNYSKYIVVLIVSSILFLIGGIFIFRKENLVQGGKIKDHLLEVIKNDILTDKERTLSEEDNEITDEGYDYKIEQLRSYYQKRMKLGKILHSTCPFPVFILDRDLKISWSSEQFRKLFSLSDDFEVTWDSFRRNTNLGENDPIDAAIRSDVGGIYQIQLRTVSSENPLPFEIYVTPAKEFNKKQVVVWLYPLQSMEETLSDQLKSTIGPVSRMLTALTLETYNPEFASELRNDFEVAGITNVLDKFDDYLELVATRNRDAQNKIHGLEEELIQKKQIIYESRETLNNLSSESSEQDFLLGELKTKFINLINYCEKLEDTEVSIVQSVSKYRSYLEKTLDQSSLQKEFIWNVQKLSTNFEELRTKVRSLKDQTMLMKKRNLSEQELMGQLENVLVEQKALQKHCDLSVSKLELYLSNLPKTDDKKFRHLTMECADGISGRDRDFRQVAGELFRTADEVVDTLKSISLSLHKNSHETNEFLSTLSSVEEIVVPEVLLTEKRTVEQNKTI
ncbi:MAG: hypothetical protein ACPGJV_10095 [Bacteriovoracaceae bacterium]